MWEEGIKAINEVSTQKYRAFIVVYKTVDEEIKEHLDKHILEKFTVHSTIMFFYAFSYSSKTNLAADNSDWDFDADFHNENKFVFNKIVGKIWDEWFMVTYGPIQHRTLGADTSKSLMTMQNVSLRRKIDNMYMRTIPNVLDHMQERSWTP